MEFAQLSWKLLIMTIVTVMDEYWSTINGFHLQFGVRYCVFRGLLCYAELVMHVWSDTVLFFLNQWKNLSVCVCEVVLPV